MKYLSIKPKFIKIKHDIRFLHESLKLINTNTNLYLKKRNQWEITVNLICIIRLIILLLFNQRTLMTDRDIYTDSQSRMACIIPGKYNWSITFIIITFIICNDNYRLILTNRRSSATEITDFFSPKILPGWLIFQHAVPRMKKGSPYP